MRRSPNAGHAIFSFWGAGGYNCPGAAHPEEVYLSVTFDLQSGREVKFNELFADYAHDQDRIIEALSGSGSSAHGPPARTTARVPMPSINFVEQARTPSAATG
jgi:hypothetical protein